MAPQNQSVELGKSFSLECDADGNPLPTLKWQFNGHPVVADARHSLENENTELIISAAQHDDEGVSPQSSHLP